RKQDRKSWEMKLYQREALYSHSFSRNPNSENSYSGKPARNTSFTAAASASVRAWPAFKKVPYKRRERLDSWEEIMFSRESCSDSWISCSALFSMLLVMYCDSMIFSQSRISVAMFFSS